MVAGIERGSLNTRRRLVIAFGAGALAAPYGSLAQPQDKVCRVANDRYAEYLTGSFGSEADGRIAEIADIPSDRVAVICN